MYIYIYLFIYVFIYIYIYIYLFIYIHIAEAGADIGTRNNRELTIDHVCAHVYLQHERNMKTETTGKHNENNRYREHKSRAISKQQYQLKQPRHQQQYANEHLRRIAKGWARLWRA